MIRLTNLFGESEWVSPDQVRCIRKERADMSRTRVYFCAENYVIVTESPEEVARKVLEYKLAMINFNHDNVAPEAELELYRLAGLEEPNHD